MPGKTNRTKASPEYDARAHMKKRCLDPDHRNWHQYGGKGVVVCAEWLHDFPAFLAHVGPRPSPKHSLDRFPDNTGNYEPGNVRWATRDEQAWNMRTNRLVTVSGRTMCVGAWAKETGLPRSTIIHRLDLGSTDTQVVATEDMRHRKLTAFGYTLSIPEWLERTGIRHNTLRSRLQRGWSSERALTP